MLGICLGARGQVAHPPETTATSSAEPALPSLPPLRDLNAYQGMRVAAVQYRGFREDSRVFAQLNELVVQEAGQPLDRQKVRRSLQALYATGRFADVQAEVEAAGPSV